VLCYGDDTGSVSLAITDGSEPFSYSFSDGEPRSPIGEDDFNPVFSGFEAGDYDVTVTDDNGCAAETLDFEINQPPALEASIESVTQVLCRDKNTGAIVADVEGGAGGNEYEWTGPDEYESASLSISGLFAGDYELTVTDNNECTDVLNVPIPQPDEYVEVNADITSQLLFNDFHMSCNQNDGEISLSFENEAQPLQSIVWEKDGGSFSPSSSLVAESLTPGVYSIEIEDADDCIASTSITLNPHPDITATATADILGNGFNTTCPDSDDGAGMVTVANGTNPSYTWFDNSTSQNISGLLPGNYTVTVIDALDCGDEATLTIIGPPAIDPNLQVASDFNGEDISCPGENDGSIAATPVNGLAPYTYEWNDSGVQTTTASLTNLTAGTYEVIVRDAYGCDAVDNVTLADPQPVQLSLNKSSFNGADVSCFGEDDGVISTDVSGGVGPYTYAWSSGDITPSASNLTAGDYSVTVTDQNGCFTSDEISLTDPPLLGVGIVHVNDFNGFDISCAGFGNGAAMAFASGGTGSWSYLWSNSETTSSIENLGPGDYELTVTDENNCAMDDEITISEPPPLGLSPTVDNIVSCNAGSDAQVSLTTTGGVTPFEYSMDQVNWEVGFVFTNLNAGLKDFYLRDANDCETTSSLVLDEPDPISISFQNIVDAQCNDPVGSAEATATGGNGNFQYDWYDDETGQFMNSGFALTNVIASIYRVAVRDVKDCPSSDLVAVSSFGGADFEFQDVTGVTCSGYNDGAASMMVTTGDGPFTFKWSNGQTDAESINMVAGNYFATLTDGLGCRTIKVIHIPTPDPLQTTVTKTLPSCVGDCDGALSVIATGGTGLLNYTWASGQITGSLPSLCAGEYALTVDDERGCSLEEIIELIDPAVLGATLTVSETSCFGNCDAGVTTIVSGGTGTYNYTWNSGQTTSSIASLCPGDYQLTLADENGCVVVEAAEVIAKNALTTSLQEGVTLCAGQSETLDIGTEWSSATWTSTNSFTSNNFAVTIGEPGDYYIEAVDLAGCIALDTFRLETSTDLLKAEFIMPSEITVGDTLVAIDISWPLPELIEWTLPSTFLQLTSGSPDFLFAVAPKEGSYKIGMQSFLAQCQDYEEKELLVIKQGNSSTSGRLGYEELITDFSLYPNPNNGEFDVSVSLSEESVIRLRVVLYPMGIVEADFESKEASDHLVHFELPELPPGVHFLLLEVREEQRMIRFMKN
jgi:hypothetical protein